MNGIKLIIIILLTIQKLYKSNNDVFLTLEKGFNCKNINNNIFDKIHHQNENKIFNSNIPFLLYITSSWCDYCCQETKILAYLQNSLYNSKNPLINNIKIYQIQSDEYIDIIKKYKIFLTKIPSLYLIKNNDEIIQYSSFFRKKDILYFIEKNLSPIQALNTIEETIKFLDNNKKKIKLLGFFIDKEKYLKEYSDFIKYDCGEMIEEILHSDISILRIWISIMLSNNQELKIKPRANNIYYSDCCFHNAGDLPVCIDEGKKAFYCYGCGYGGTIISLIHKYSSNLDRVSVLRVLTAFIEKDTTNLNKVETEYYDEIFKYYNSEIADYYFEISRQKTMYLENRIHNYLKMHRDNPETRSKATRRLCCTRMHIARTFKG